MTPEQKTTRTLAWTALVIFGIFFFIAHHGQPADTGQAAPVAAEQPVADTPAPVPQPVAPPPPAAWTSKDRAAPLAHDARLGPYESEHLDFVDTMVLDARAKGYQCDLVNAALPMILTRGFRLVCDGYTHVYDIKDVGGTWMLSVE